MFFYSQDAAFNVVVSLYELEACVLLMSQGAAELDPDFSRWDECGGALARAMETGGKIHVTVERDAVRAPLHGWRGALDDAPEPQRGAVSTALDFFAEGYGRTLDRTKVEIIGLDGPGDGNEKDGK